MNPKVSILIPTYNQPEYIVQASQSALAQDYKNLEVIVSDDSSNNETNKLLATFTSDNRFTYYRTALNIGRVANYRKLLYDYATGDWVVILDGDDYYTDSNYITKAIELINKNDKIVLVGAGILIKNEKKNSKYSYNLGTNTIVFDGKEVFTKYKRIPNHQTDIYNREKAMALNFYRDPSMGSDSESIYRLCLRGDVGYIAQDVAVWRLHEENTSYKRDLQTQIKEITFIDSIYKDALNYLTAAELKSWKDIMMNYAGNHLLQIAINQKKSTSVWFLAFKYFDIKTALLHLVKYYRLQILGGK